MTQQHGSLEVICGSMFSGKTEELIRRIRRAQIARRKVQVFKPAIDIRYQVEKVTSHNGLDVEAIPVSHPDDILEHLHPDTAVVAIDEIQFFDPYVVEVCSRIADRGVRVIAAGLDLDFRGEPFGPMPMLLATAEQVDKLQAICVVCAEPACRTQRLINGAPAYYEDPVILIGASELYEARCRKCHQVPHREVLKS